MRTPILLFILLSCGLVFAQPPGPPQVVEFEKGEFVFVNFYDSLPKVQGFDGLTAANYFLNRDRAGEKNWWDSSRYFIYVEPCNAWSDGKKWGLISNEGKITAPCAYDHLFRFCPYNQKNKHTTWAFLACKNGKWGVLNFTGKELIPLIYDLPYAHEADGVCYFTMPEQPACNYNKEIACQGQMLDSGRFHFPAFGGNMIFMQNGKYGMVDTLEGKVLIPFEYDQVIYSKNGVHSFKKGKKSFLFTTGGLSLSAYSEVRSSPTGYHNVKKKGKWGYIDPEGKEITPCMFDDAAEVTWDDLYHIYSTEVMIKGNGQGLRISGDEVTLDGDPIPKK
jgi:hypothetical protein